eukprot:m51a1_g2380 hypothetical protein (422) ;mRNA; r:696223-699215
MRWQKGVGTVYLLTVVTLVTACCVLCARNMPSPPSVADRSAPPQNQSQQHEALCVNHSAACPKSNPGVWQWQPPRVESNAVAGHASNATFNPSIVGNVAPLAARCPPSPIVVLYRDFDYRQGKAWSSVSAHVWTPPATGFAGLLSECTPSPAVLLNVTDMLLVADEADNRSRSRCKGYRPGYEDLRGFVISDGTLVVIANNVRPRDCRRRMALIRVPLAEVTSTAAAGGSAVQIPSVTWLSYNERALKEKNWVPFAEGPHSTVLVTYSLQPHIVLACPTQGDIVSNVMHHVVKLLGLLNQKEYTEHRLHATGATWMVDHSATELWKSVLITEGYICQSLATGLHWMMLIAGSAKQETIVSVPVLVKKEMPVKQKSHVTVPVKEEMPMAIKSEAPAVMPSLPSGFANCIFHNCHFTPGPNNP